MKCELCTVIILILMVFPCNECRNKAKEDSEDEKSNKENTISDKSNSNEDVDVSNTNIINSVKSAAVLQLPKSSEDIPSKPKKSPSNLKIQTVAKLKESLKHIQGDDVKRPEEIEKIKNRFKKYEEIKKEMSELNLFPRSDSEIIKQLLEDYKSATNDENILTFIEDFDYLVHQYDNAQEFMNLNGFKEIIYRNINSTNPKIRAEALKLLGSAVQHNAKVQIHALETDAVNILLKVLAIDSNHFVKMRAVFALSSLLRRFPIAQFKFVENAGLSVFSTFFDKPQDIKIQLKIITLLNDLLIEHQHAKNDSNAVDFVEKTKQYSLVNLNERLKNDNWCQKIENVLKNVILVDEMDHDSIQKCLEFMKSVSDICGSNYSQNTLRIVRNLREIYEDLVFSEQSDDFGTEYYLDMRNLCDDVLKNITMKVVKTEL
ncbi:nucleotide exchange factor SIL1-like [Agrilus planipennis]|uniref:Nucleotide exchange factor SIL1 n=1 Tax=Agrilus planipennis TaxID=224129 RepID=A0A1W4WGN1_AGRPL|nr:nucleotide exchange factor SIL1-like [Agrilus planipennis]